MILTKLTLENYRIFSKKHLEFQRGINFVIGKNSNGKTTILESILFAFSGELLNTFNPINYNQMISKISVDFSLNQVSNNITILLKKKDEKFEKSIYLNEKKIDKQIEIKQKFLSPIILNAFDISSQEPEKKRNIIDRFLKLDKDFIIIFENHKKILKQKTTLLKIKSNHDLLNSINKKIVDYSSLISKKRIDLLIEILPDLKISCQKFWKNIQNLELIYITGSGLKINNQSSLDIIKQNYQKTINLLQQKELEKQKILVSSNRDNFEFIVTINNNKYPIKNIFSQSQINIFILLLFFNLVKRIRRIYEYYPVLLLDEPFVFLDKINTQKILKTIQNYPQAIITSNSPIENQLNKIIELEGLNN